MASMLMIGGYPMHQLNCISSTASARLHQLDTNLSVMLLATTPPKSARLSLEPRFIDVDLTSPISGMNFLVVQDQ